MFMTEADYLHKLFQNWLLQVIGTDLSITRVAWMSTETKKEMLSLVSISSSPSAKISINSVLHGCQYYEMKKHPQLQDIFSSSFQ